MKTLDWFVVVVYLLFMLGMGFWHARRSTDLKEYFLAGRVIPWWAALFSLVATEISAATFLGAPEQGLTRDMSYLQFSVGTIAARFVLAAFFIGAFYHFKVYTIYGFLLERFGLATNTTTAAVFLVGRLFADGSRLFIASIAINVATGISMGWSIIIFGLTTLAYTLAGGMTAVIWTDVAQAVVMLVGVTALVYSLWSQIGMSAGAVFATLSEANKFQIFDFSLWMNDGRFAPLFNPYHALPAIVGGFFLTMATHGTDHDMVQRLLTCRESKDGKRSMWVSGFLGLSFTVVFIFIGQLLFLFVQGLPAGHPMLQTAELLKAEGRNGHFLLYYVLNYLPAGLAGLVIASLLASAMSTLSSALNAMSATFIADFYQRYWVKDASSTHYVKMSRWMTAGIGLTLIGVALQVLRFYEANPKTDLLSIALGVMTFFYGALLGIFLVAFLSRTRGNTWSNIAGAVASIGTIIILKSNTELAWPWFIVVGTLVTMAIALLGKTAVEVRERYAQSSADALAEAQRELLGTGASTQG
ncbi:MAG: sodium/solute symporter [Candidatus Sericytochromatia bacterium]|nr:sodium/solute symporter [Candidatus Sericytochromatia bacterium]